MNNPHESRYWRQDLIDSYEAFQDIIFPKIQYPWFDGGKLLPIESNPDKTAQIQDRKAGIDYYVEIPKGLVSIGSRVQCDRIYWPEYTTFTVRKDRISGADTEFEKRLYALEHGFHIPFYTIQSYLNKRKKMLEDGEHQQIRNVAMCKTRDLYLHIRNGKKGLDWEIGDAKKNGAATFYYVDWHRLLEVGIEVKLHKEIKNIQTTLGNKKNREAG